MRSVAHLVGVAVLVAIFTGCHAYKDIKLNLSPNITNPSLIYYQDEWYISTRTLRFERRKVGPQPKIRWWVSSSSICSFDWHFHRAIDCQEFKPWRSYEECLVPPFQGMEEGTGIEDLKFFEWPGRGLFGMFGRKPRRPQGSVMCPSNRVFNTYMTRIYPQLISHGSGIRWETKPPLRLRLINTTENHFINDVPQHKLPPNATVIERPPLIREKNWMPFLYEGKLHFMYSFNPTRIIQRVTNDGGCLTRYVHTPSLPSDLHDAVFHGGPPIILIPHNYATGTPAHYLGIVHHYVKIPNPSREVKFLLKQYHHHAFKMEAQPPFKVTAVSREIPLKFEPLPGTTDRAYALFVSYVSGLQYIQAGDPVYNISANTLVISYGSSDIAARVLLMSMDEMNALFT